MMDITHIPVAKHGRYPCAMCEKDRCAKYRVNGRLLCEECTKKELKK